MNDLVGRLEQAASGSRELDAEIARLFGGQVVRRFGDFDWRENGTGFWQKLPPVTTSIDAAVALAERVLPGWESSFAQRRPRHLETCSEWWHVSLFPVPENIRGFNTGRDTVTVRAATPALALCAAFIRAHAEQVQG